ncbi:hypothetical protein E4U42_003431 [Claviceps africana]|uniref:Phosphotransferase n=1 Tax=Claviceps africana TaxID=83212 RepID=A0A8K0NLK2_9HYPO|nr:hypothetical protein E4U42_003431 [Claviceps africana]
MGSSPEQSVLLNDFLQPMSIDVEKCHVLSHALMQNFMHLAADSLDQFLPTPISESILRPVADYGRGSGGTNLRVGFVELSASDDDNDLKPNGTNHFRDCHGETKTHVTATDDEADDDRESHCVSTSPSSRLHRHLERSWPIANHLKNDNADSLFLWIGKCIAEVVAEGCQKLGLARDSPIPLGVTFSFPMEQPSLERATITSMGKGFAMPPNVDLGICLIDAYDRHRRGSTHNLPPVYAAAIANDSVSTLVSFIFHYDGMARRRAAMGLILGTGSNATIPVKLSMLHPSKRPRKVNVLAGEKVEDAKIAVNTEWSINGTAPPMRELGLITAWDDELSAQNERPGFQPLEYMTAGRYLGELGRIMLLDYLIRTCKVSRACLPRKLLQQDSLTTTFLSHFKPLDTKSLLWTLRLEFPEPVNSGFAWTEHDAEALYRIAKAIEVRAAGIIAAAILALLTVGGELPAEEDASIARSGDCEGCDVCELGVGYTGGCVVHFQDYLEDCQDFINQLVARRFGTKSRWSVVMRPCHDGGITGAAILSAAALSSQRSQT